MISQTQVLLLVLQVVLVLPCLLLLEVLLLRR